MTVLVAGGQIPWSEYLDITAPPLPLRLKIKIYLRKATTVFNGHQGVNGSYQSLLDKVWIRVIEVDLRLR